jgi:hypothetical protein
MANWSVSLDKYADRQKLKIKKVRRAYAFALYSSIVKKTPVDTGRASGNWNVSVGSEDSSTSDRKTPKYKSMEQMPDSNGDESIFISNNLPYIGTLENGGYPNPPEKGTWNKKTKSYEIRSANGYSKKASSGMVGVTLANNEAIFKAAVRSCDD